MIGRHGVVCLRKGDVVERCLVAFSLAQTHATMMATGGAQFRAPSPQASLPLPCPHSGDIRPSLCSVLDLACCEAKSQPTGSTEVHPLYLFKRCVWCSLLGPTTDQLIRQLPAEIVGFIAQTSQTSQVRVLESAALPPQLSPESSPKSSPKWSCRCPGRVGRISEAGEPERRWRPWSEG